MQGNISISCEEFLGLYKRKIESDILIRVTQNSDYSVLKDVIADIFDFELGSSSGE